MLRATSGSGNGSSSTTSLSPYTAPLNVGFAGDSIGGQWAGQWSPTTTYNIGVSQSPILWAAIELYPCDLQFVMNTAVGGTSSSHLLTVQLAQLQALTVKPDLLIVQSLQNDYMGTISGADGYVANVTSYATQALAAGVKMVVICSHPPKSSVPDVASVLVYANRKLELFCRATKGTFYCDVFGAWRNTQAADTNGVPWKGVVATVTGYTEDGTHPNALAARAAAPLILPILKALARPINPMPAAYVAYDNVNLPFNNVFGANGGMIGTGGQYNGVNNANVAGNSQNNGDRWTLVDGSGIVATPTIVTGADGYLYQQLTFSGTATADVVVNLNFAYFNDIASGQFFNEAIIETQNLIGPYNIQWVNANLLMGTNKLSRIDGTTTRFHIRSQPSTFSNSGFVTRNYSLQLSFANGTLASGAIRLGRTGLYRVG